MIELTGDGLGKQGIQVVEHDEDGNVTGQFIFWGRMKIDMNNGGGTISINAPGYHNPTHDEMRYSPEHNPESNDKGER